MAMLPYVYVPYLASPVYLALQVLCVTQLTIAAGFEMAGRK